MTTEQMLHVGFLIVLWFIIRPYFTRRRVAKEEREARERYEQKYGKDSQ